MVISMHPITILGVQNLFYHSMITLKGAGASEAFKQTKEGALSKRYFQTSKIAQNRTKSRVPIDVHVFGVPTYGNPYGSKIAIVWLFFIVFRTRSSPARMKGPVGPWPLLLV